MKKSLLSKVDWTTIVQILAKIVGVFLLVFSFLASNHAYSKELQNQFITIKAKQIMTSLAILCKRRKIMLKSQI